MPCARASRVAYSFAVLAIVGCASTNSSELRIVETPRAPSTIGPYSQGVVVNGLLFTAGQIPRDPATSQLVVGDISVQTSRVLDNLEAVLSAAGCSFKDVVKATVFLADLNDFARMNEVFAARFGVSRPARTTVEAKLPAGARIEIDLVARVPR